MRMRRGEAELFVEVNGQGPAVLLVHGFPLDRTLWRSTVEDLVARFRLVTIDLRGFGDSTGVARSIDELADDAVAALDANGIPMAAIVGLSMGGYVALSLWARHPGRVSALALVDTRAGADSDEGRRARDAAIASVRENGPQPFLDGQPARLLAPDASPQVREQLMQMMRRQPATAICGALAAMRDRPDRSHLLATIDCPTMVVVGEKDVITPPGEARAMAARIPGARLVELPGVGHLTPLEAPTAFSTVLGDFLDGALPAD